MLRSYCIAVLYALIGAILEPDSTAPLLSGNITFDVMCVKVPLLSE
jgi:hypothetical protein